MRSIIRTLAALGLSAALMAAPLSVSAASAGSTVAGFTDVPADAWYASNVEQAVSLGLMKGKGNGRFAPNDKLSVAEAITMAVQLHSRLFEEPFTPGGNPWYRNALVYAQDHGLVLPGEFRDYTAPATRAQMAGLFAYTMPPEMCQRINRVGAVPDVDADEPYADAIYLLYQIGVLAGTGGGAFQPGTTIDRASAAAILNRAALPESRVSFTLPAAGEGVTAESPDQSFRFTLPQGSWTELRTPDGVGIRYLDRKSSFTALSCKRDSRDLSDFAAQHFLSLGPTELLEQPGVTLFRGIPSISWRYREAGVIHTVFCLENTGSRVVLELTVPDGAGRDADYSRLLSAAFTLDLAL